VFSKYDSISGSAGAMVAPAITVIELQRRRTSLVADILRLVCGIRVDFIISVKC